MLPAWQRSLLRCADAFGWLNWADDSAYQLAAGVPRFSSRHLQFLLKRALDVVISALILLTLSPLLLAIALITQLTNPGSVFFAQQRVGLRGRIFRLFKFRTMRQERERRFAFDGMPAPSPVFKMTNDPRFTRFGRWLRDSSLDGLPQLWNVLRGDMSLIGPRPLLILESNQIDELLAAERVSVKPGLISLADTSGLTLAANFHRYLARDLDYIRNWSLLLDCKVVAAAMDQWATGRRNRSGSR